MQFYQRASKINSFYVRISCMTKHQQILRAMLEENPEIFAEFQIIHDNYKENQEKYQDEFNKKGEKVLEIIRNYESSLVAKSTSSQFAKFSNNLSDKFWTAIRGKFPMIDFVGAQVIK